jgi:DNA helicase-2/ATP-dependent DNA helicase PcrA
VETLGQHAFQNEVPLFEALVEAPRLTPKAAGSILNFREVILSLKMQLEACSGVPESVVAWAKTCLEKVHAKEAVQADCDDPLEAARKWENVEELLHSMGQFQLEDTESQTQSSGAGVVLLREFLNRMTLDAQEIEKEEHHKQEDVQKNQVTLLTLHGAKGLEFPIVFLVGMEDGFLPHRRTIEEASDFGEERRLCYVGITRAKDDLFILRARQRIRYGKPVPRVRSRFLDEIPNDFFQIRNLSSSPEGSSPEAQKDHETQVKNYLAEIRAKILQKR